ncbi:MAG: NADH-quinone oxidoreductase subunit J [Euryarchaeota archaeon]|nr:NADH-quinone oxidoreductase subunit J [Euryarchaeota archaeon]
MTWSQDALKLAFALAVLGLLVASIGGSGLDTRKPVVSATLTRDLARSLFQDHSLPLVLVGLILAVAMVSGVFLAKEEWHK